MISTGAFQTEMDASTKQETLAEKFARVWEKKNSKVARAGGVSLMALSLAACGSDDDTSSAADTSGTTDTGSTDTSEAEVVTPVTTAMTTGVDIVSGTTANDTFNAGDVAGVAALTVGDSVSGGAGTDTLNIITTAAFAGMPVGSSLSSIENVNVITGGNVTIDTSGTDHAGVTTLTTDGVGAATVTAAATTDVTVETATHAATAVAVNGGDDVTITTAGTTTGTVTVGATTAASGDVTVTVGSSAADGVTQGATAVTGGDSISITSALTNAVNTTNTQSAMTATGDANTASVTITQDTAATAAAAVVGKVGGAVTIADANAGTDDANTIATVTINNSAAATVDSNALSTLNITGTTGTVNTTNTSTATTAAVTTLDLNVNGATSGNVTADAEVTTLNIDSSTAASTLADITAAGATTVNVTGDAALTLTDNSLAAVTAINVTNTAGATFGTTALGAAVVFTGGAGDDTVSLGANTVAVTMGAGDDTVTSAGLVGTGGTVDAGDGTDTIIMAVDEAEVADGDSTFNTAFTNFEVLQISDAMDDAGVDLDGVNSVDHVILTTGTDAGGNSALTNMDSGGRVEFTADNANALGVTVKSAIVSASDVMNVELTGSDIVVGTTTIANVETVNIIMSDGAAPIAANAGGITLTAAAATSVNVSGNSGVAVTATGSVAVTNFDASGIVGNSTVATATAAATTDTAAELAVTYTSVNATANAAVSITGGAGNDVLTGSAAAVNVDTITGGEGADNITGGTGNDVIILTETTAAADTVVMADATTTGVDTIQGFASGTGADILSLLTAATDDATGAGDAVIAATAVALTAGAASYATGLAADAQDVIEITTTLSSHGDLDATGATSGTELLKALSSTDAAATNMTTTNSAADGFYIAAYQDGDAFIYQVIDDGSNNATVIASEINLIAIMEDVAAGSLATSDIILA